MRVHDKDLVQLDMQVNFGMDWEHTANSKCFISGYSKIPWCLPRLVVTPENINSYSSREFRKVSLIMGME